MYNKAEHPMDGNGSGYSGSGQNKKGSNGKATTLIAIGIIIAIAAIIVIFTL